MRRAFYRLPKIFRQFTNCLIWQIDANICIFVQYLYTLRIIISHSSVIIPRGVSLSDMANGKIPVDIRRTFLYWDSAAITKQKCQSWENLVERLLCYCKLRWSSKKCFIFNWQKVLRNHSPSFASILRQLFFSVPFQMERNTIILNNFFWLWTNRNSVCFILKKEIIHCYGKIPSTVTVLSKHLPRSWIRTHDLPLGASEGFIQSAATTLVTTLRGIVFWILSN